MKEFVPVLRFVASSDLHYREEFDDKMRNFERGIDLVYEYCSNCTYKDLDAWYVAGDFTDRGYEAQMRNFRQSVETHLKKGTELVVSMASHEYRDGPETAAARMKEILGFDPDSHHVIKGFHFIMPSTSTGCHYDEEKRDWIRGELQIAAAEDHKKPIFFFQHPHITDTVYGSIDWGEKDLAPILVNYPQVIDFSGHSHAPVNDPRSVYQKHFTAFGTGSFNYFELDEFDKYYGTVPPGVNVQAQLLVVEVAADYRVRVLPYNVLSESFYPFVWQVDTPWDPDSFTYTDKRYLTQVKPYFAPEACLTVKPAGEHAAEVTFSQALIDEDGVNEYFISFKRADGTVARKIGIWSEYYKTPMPESLTETVDGLEPGEIYTVEVTAGGFWKNYSDRPMTAKFRL